MENRIGYAPAEVQFSSERLYRNPLEQQVIHFDKNWRQEGLPYDWFNLDEVGFSLKRQMSLLEGLDSVSKSKWIQQTRRDILGFGLEYLRQGAVFPFEYEIVRTDKGLDLIDPKYGGRRLLDTVDPAERNGVVAQSLQKMQEHLLSGGETAVMVSPDGWTGLKTDKGKDIVYEDTQVYFLKREGDSIVGTTFRTDFSLGEAKEVVRIMTGITLPDNASSIDVVRTVALGSDKNIKPEDAVFSLKKARGEARKEPYKGKSWQNMFDDIKNRDFLYDFDKKIETMIEDFEESVLSDNLPKFDIQKALAATILRISKHSLFEGKHGVSDELSHHSYDRKYADIGYVTYGDVLDKVKELPGCAGGGSSTKSITDRLTSIKDRGYDFDHEGTCAVCNSGPKALGPCEICEDCVVKIEREEE